MQGKKKAVRTWIILGRRCGLNLHGIHFIALPSLTSLAMHTVTFTKFFMADVAGSVAGGHNFDVVGLGFNEDEGAGAANNDAKTAWI